MWWAIISIILGILFGVICLGVIALLIDLKVTLLPWLLGKGLYPGADMPYEAEFGPRLFKYESLFIDTDDHVKIHAKFFPTSNEKGTQHVPSILYLYVNGESSGTLPPNYRTLTLYCNILVIDYRCYGLSDKQLPCSEAGLVLDAKAGLDHLYSRTDVDHTRIHVYGRSLGAAVAIGLLSQVKADDQLSPVKSLILENGFTSVNAVIKESVLSKAAYHDMVEHKIDVPRIPRWLIRSAATCLYPLVWLIRDVMIPSTWHSLERIKSLHSSHPDLKLLLLVGAEDTLIPPSHSTQLHDSCLLTDDNKRLVSFSKGNHNNTCHQPNYAETMRALVEAHLPVVNF
jgi:pimeloyl-ACP methyl ester carboxylesterase